MWTVVLPPTVDSTAKYAPWFLTIEYEVASPSPRPFRLARHPLLSLIADVGCSGELTRRFRLLYPEGNDPTRTEGTCADFGGLV